MRRVGEPASHSRSWVRGNFHIAPTLTPALSLREGEGVVALPHRVPSPSKRERELAVRPLAPVRGRGMRRVGEPASHSRSWVRGNFHIAPTLTPALSLREGEGVVALPHRVLSPSKRERELAVRPLTRAR